MSFDITRVTALIVNYRTLEHTRSCIATLRAAYPALRLVVVDNGSADASTAYLRQLESQDHAAVVLFNEKNHYHGPALHQGISAADSRYILLLDSDCEVLHGGFLETLVTKFTEDPLIYAIGKRGWTNRHGYFPVDRSQAHTAYVHPFACVLDREKYFQLPPAVHHGAPLWRNMWGARRAGYRLEHFPIEDYVLHHGEVTARVHGYAYGRRLRAQLIVNRWEARARATVASITGRQLQPPTLPPEHSS